VKSRPLARRLLARAGRGVARLDRRRTPHWIVLRVLPRAISMRFDPASADGLEACLELAIRDPHGRAPARFELTIEDGRCAVSTGGAPRAGARAIIGSDDLILLASGAASWPELLSSGRFELSGDPFLALRFAALFRMRVQLEPA
jgi:SCP-2 sterol transfer family